MFNGRFEPLRDSLAIYANPLIVSANFCPSSVSLVRSDLDINSTVLLLTIAGRWRYCTLHHALSHIVRVNDPAS